MPRSTGIRPYRLAAGVFGVLLLGLAGRAQEAAKPAAPPADNGVIPVQVPPSPGPEQPAPPTTTPTPTPTTEPTAAAGGGAGGGGGAPSLGAQPTPRAAATGSGTASVGQGEALTRPTGDVGELLARSESSTGVQVQFRSPIVTDPRIRGYQDGQIFTFLDGGYYTPARRDLDTIVSKIDPTAIRDVIVFKGPFTTRYGPGLAFLDVETQDPRRYQDGWEGHGSTSLLYKTNGNQWKGRQAFWGGAEDFGFRIGYDLAAGNDYETGADVRMPSSYNTQNLDFAFAFWLCDDSYLMIKGIRADQQNVELPGQVFDITRLICDGYSVRYVLMNQDYFDRLTAEGWYNYTRLQGNDLNPAKRVQIPQLNETFINNNGMVQAGLGLTGFTQADVISSGLRQYFTWGKEKCPQLFAGVDLRYLSQALNEFDTATGFTSGNYPIPRSHWADPGLFLEAVVPVNKCLLLRGGFRVDWVDTNIDNYPTQVTPAVQQAFPPGADYSRDFHLLSGYVSGEYKANDNLTGLASFGIGQRAPTLTELYAFAPLIAVLQNGLNSTQGNPGLLPEQVWQLDLGAKADYERFRAGLHGFCAWIHDYITYEAMGTVVGQSPITGITVRFVNTDRAIIAGTELYGEYDVTCYLTPFTTLTYVGGLDLTRDARGINSGVGPGSGPEEPLPGFPPLEARVGLRLHQAKKQPDWAVEVSARIVSHQDRIAQSLDEVATPGFTVWDFRSYWQVTKALLLTMGVENFGNKNYQEHLDLRTGTGAFGRFGVFQPGTNFYFGAQVQY
jgi:outer membrane receptor protein involved in Fe transport